MKRIFALFLSCIGVLVACQVRSNETMPAIPVENQKTEVEIPTATSTPEVFVTPTLNNLPAETPTPVRNDNPATFWMRPADKMKMVKVPGGAFQMGSTEAEIEDAIALCQQHYSICNRWYYERESPAHMVSLDEFWIDQTEITNAQYRLCVDAGICGQPSTCRKGESTFGDPNLEKHPVVCVDWNDAQAYCQWVDARLPTEAEWEYAFRGTAGWLYPWGDEFDGTRLNYCDANCSQSHADDNYDDGHPQTAPVGSHPSGASWSGVLNLSGNVSEWVADWFSAYTTDGGFNPSGPPAGNEKMFKGCNWYHHPAYCRGAARPSVVPETRFNFLGFRCASSDSTQQSQDENQSNEIINTTEGIETPDFIVPDGKLGDVLDRPPNNVPMVFVPAGTFLMGSSDSDPNAADAEFPQHEVHLGSFWIDQTEVTNEQHNLCVEAGACRKSRYANDPAASRDLYPAVGLAWDDAVNYCAWAGGRLPTEAEWEYAAKGQGGLAYPWGDAFDGNLVNFCDTHCDEDWADPHFDDGYHESAPVGSFPGGASWVGALDMAGNVWEWVWDWCGSYSSSPQINPTGPEDGNCKIIRGGAWASPPDGIRTSYRLISDEITPIIRHPNIGFRCVLSGQEGTEGEETMSIDPIPVSLGGPATIDGTISPGEWDQATVESFADGSQLLLMQNGGFLYVGIRASGSGMIAGNIHIQQGDEISVLHSSAALGTAIYRKTEMDWQKIQDFTWRCRNTGNSPSAQAERAEFLEEEGWLAANGRMGTPNELEYQIKIPDQEYRLAAVYIKATPPYEKVPWPSDLDDACIQPTPGGFPDSMAFSPDQWRELLQPGSD